MGFETVIYPPFKVLGFSSSVFLFGNIGMIGGQEFASLVKGNIYQGYGLGLRLQNDKIGLDFIEISFAYYPFNHLDDANDYNYWFESSQFRKIESNNLLERGGINPSFEF